MLALPAPRIELERRRAEDLGGECYHYTIRADFGTSCMNWDMNQKSRLQALALTNTDMEDLTTMF